MKEFGPLLRVTRLRAGVKVGQLARHLGVTAGYLYRVENGGVPPLTPERIFAASRLLATEPHDLLLAAAADGGRFVFPVEKLSSTGLRALAALRENGGVMPDAAWAEVLHLAAGAGRDLCGLECCPRRGVSLSRRAGATAE